MTCEHAREHLSELIDGDPGPVRAAVERHVASCADCARLLARLRAAVAALADLGVASPDGLAERVLLRVPRPAARPVPARMRWTDVRRVAGWALILGGAAWQLGGGALAAQAMGRAVPVITEARETVARTQALGVASELERAGEGVLGLARGVGSARRILNDRED